MLSKWSVACGLALIVTVLVVDGVSAQEKGRRGGGYGRGRGGIVPLVTVEAVQKELDISGDLKDKVAAVALKWATETTEKTKGLPGFQNLTPEEIQQRLAKMTEVHRTLTAKYASSIKELLKPEQFTRLQQINWQSMGGLALSEPDVAKELAVTKEQQDKIAVVNQDHQLKQAKLMASEAGAGGNPQEFGIKFRELTQQSDKMAKEVLTKEQQEKYAKLKGKPFDLTQL